MITLGMIIIFKKLPTYDATTVCHYLRRSAKLREA